MSGVCVLGKTTSIIMADPHRSTNGAMAGCCADQAMLRVGIARGNIPIYYVLKILDNRTSWQ
jgi:hypothetical protein